MIVDTSEANIISTQGWSDHGAIWLCQTISSSWQEISLSKASYLTLHEGLDNLFAAVHHFNPPQEDRVMVTAHAITSPEQALASVTLAGQEPVWEGDARVWDSLPHAYIISYRQNGDLYRLLLINGQERQVELQRLSWYDNDSYDQGYQQLLEATEIPGQELLLISIQRDSNPVLYDARQQKAVGKVSLANRSGNPHLQFRHRASELWADDYDTLVRLDPRDWTVLNSLRLQYVRSATGGNNGIDNTSAGVALFIGGFAFNKDESLCAVARPFSGDVVALDTEAFEVRYRAATGGQPLDVALLSDGRVFCRDWKSEEPLFGRLEPSGD